MGQFLYAPPSNDAKCNIADGYGANVTWDIDVIQDIKIVKRGNKLLIDDVIEYK